MLLTLLAYLFLTTGCIAQTAPLAAWSAAPFNPPSLPLAVKSSYLNVWAPLGYGNGSAALSDAWPRNWDRSLTPLEWYGAIRVDGIAYRFLGNSGRPAGNIGILQKGFSFTPTRSSYLYQTGPVNVNVTFLSPVEPTDLVRQSMPFSYMYITVQPNDGGSHSVQLYSDVSGEFIGGDPGVLVNWTINESSDFVYLQMNPSSPLPFQELNNRPQDGALYYCMKKGNGVSWQIANSADMRGQFINGSITSLPKTSDGSFHSVSNPFFDALAIAVDLGTITSASDPVVYALGVVRDPVVRYTNRNLQIEERSSYYWSNFSNIHDAIKDVLDHFNDAMTDSTTLDDKILNAAGQVSTNYADILSLSTRQAMGALEYTLLKDASGNFNMSDVKVFMKDMGGVGSGGISAVDVLYAAMPAYLYLNPDILGYLLSPLMEYQESKQYTNPYAAQDLGNVFPNAIGNAFEHNQKIEHSANMIIMSLAHAQASGDGRLIEQHYSLLKKWANYLVSNTMNPGDQTASVSDAINASNQTNVVLKGLIGIGAMAKISGYTGHTADQTSFNTVVQQYTQQWTNIAAVSAQISISFGTVGSGLIYNLYADKLLQLNLIPRSIYDTQTRYYKGQISLWKYGIPLDTLTTSTITRSDWMMFAAASTSDESVRDAMHSQVHGYISTFLPQNLPFPILYNPRDATQIGGENSPAIGATFANLALSLPIKSISVTGPLAGGSSVNNTTAIIGGAVSGAVGLFVIGAGILFYRRHRRKQGSIDKYNGVGRIYRSRSENYPSGSMFVLHPPDSSPHSNMAELTITPYTHQSTNGGGAFFNITGSNYATPTSTGMQAVSAKDWESHDAACVKYASESRAPPSNPSPSGSNALSPSAPPGLHSNNPRQGDWRAEMEVLRQEIEQIKQERDRLAAPPPAYEDELRSFQAMHSR